MIADKESSWERRDARMLDVPTDPDYPNSRGIHSKTVEPTLRRRCRCPLASLQSNPLQTNRRTTLFWWKQGKLMSWFWVAKLTQITAITKSAKSSSKITKVNEITRITTKSPNRENQRNHQNRENQRNHQVTMKSTKSTKSTRSWKSMKSTKSTKTTKSIKIDEIN